MGLTTEIIVKDSVTELAVAAADILTRSATDCVDLRGLFVTALAGGSTPRQMHTLLSEEPYLSRIPWDRTHLFWGDERCVPESHPASNYGQAKKDLLDRVPIPLHNVHPMPTTDCRHEGPDIYSKELQKIFPIKTARFPLFDLIFLGVGKDGHTASLFPGQAALEEREKWVVAVKGGKPNVERLTLTFPVLNHAREIVFLVSGEGKAPILKTLFENRGAQLPAQRVQPENGRLIWLLDRDAASLLSGGIPREGS